MLRHRAGHGRLARPREPLPRDRRPGRVRRRPLRLRRDRDRGAARRRRSPPSPGQTVALVGHTGAGKSTVVKLLARFYDPTGGPGADRRPRPARRDVATRCARSSGSCPRRASCSRAPCASNIAFGRPDASLDDVVAAAEAVGADAFIRALPDGYDTEIQERGARLSIGQRQLVAFARALLADPRILILDEATSSVDIPTEARIEEALETLLARAHGVRRRPPPEHDPAGRRDRRARARRR